MTYFADLAPNTYFGRWQDVLVSVGWLDAVHEPRRGGVSEEFFRALVLLLVEPWQPVVFAGHGVCERCRFSGGPSKLVFEGNTIMLGSNNLFVPADDHRVFVAPSLIAHYIDAHEYAPPDEFQRAVVACPRTSIEHRRKLLERGIRLQ